MGVTQVIAPTAAPTVLERANFLVQTKSKWADAWTPSPYLQPVTATQTISPGVPSAEFLWRYGDIKREDSSVFSLVSPVSLQNQYIQILIVDGNGSRPLWTGIVTDESFDIHASKPGAAAQGDQSVYAYGLEHLLDRKSIIGAFVEEQGVTTPIGWCPSFNDRGYHGETLSGNRSTAVGPEGVHRFSREGKDWTHRDILLYLLKYYALENLPMVLSGQEALLDNLKSSVNFEGLTLRQCLDKLIDRRRGLGWCLRVTDTGTIAIHVFSVFDETISVGGVSAAPNQEQFVFVFDSAIDISRAVIKSSVAAQYDRVRVQGERIQTCFTMSPASSNIEPAWTPQEQADYNSSVDWLRRTDKFRRVYQAFRIPANWDWTVKRSTFSPALPVIPSLTNDGRINETGSPPPPWNYPRGFLRQIPILKPGGIANAEPEYMEPLVLIRDDASNPTTTVLYHQVENLRAMRRDSASVRMMDREMGFELNSRANHVFAISDFNPGSLPASSVPPQMDYRNVFATVALECDQRLTVEVDIAATPTNEVKRTLTIDVFGAELWYAPTDTIIGLTGQNELIYHPGGPLRDDSERLRFIAALAKAWYGKRRAAVEIQIKGIAEMAVPGSMIVSASSGVQEQPVGTIVSNKHLDFTNQTTTIMTDYTEIDLSAVADIPNMSDFRAVGRAFNKQANEIKKIKKHIGNLDVRRPAGGNGGGGGPTLGEIASGNSMGPFTVRLYPNGYGSSPDPLLAPNVVNVAQSLAMNTGDRVLVYEMVDGTKFIFSKVTIPYAIHRGTVISSAGAGNSQYNVNIGSKTVVADQHGGLIAGEFIPNGTPVIVFEQGQGGYFMKVPTWL